MEIRIIGSNTKEGYELRKRVIDVVMELDEKVTVSLEDDIKLIKKYNITKRPALIINNNLTIEGRLITSRELNKILKSKYKLK